MSLIEKIDAEIAIRNEIIKNSHGMELDTRATIGGLQIARQIILAEQKEFLTIGDKIRESNESLAEFIERNLDENRDDWEPVGCYNCIYHGTHHADPKNRHYECGDCEFKEGILNYLNQPYKVS